MTDTAPRRRTGPPAEDDADGFPMRMEFSDDESDIAMEFSSIGSTSFEIPADDRIGTV